MKRITFKLIITIAGTLICQGVTIAQWTKLYNGTDSTSDRSKSIAVDGSKNVYVTGKSKGISSDYDYLTIKYDSLGVVKWTQRYNGPGNYVDEPVDIEVDNSGNVYVTGYSCGNGTDLDYATIKYNSEGSVQWTNRFNNLLNSDDRAVKLSFDNLGNVIVAGYSYGDLVKGYDFVTIKYSLSGTMIWTRQYGLGSPDEFTTDVKADAFGNVIVTGCIHRVGFVFDYLLIKYDPAGAIEWTKIYNGPANHYDQPTRLAIDNLNNIYVTGYSYGNGTLYDVATLKYNSAGELQWLKRYSGPDSLDDVSHDIEVDNLGNVYLTGYSHDTTSSTNILSLKYNSSGTLLWSKIYEGIADSFDKGNDLAIDNSGNVYVTGFSTTTYNGSLGEDIITIKYNNDGVIQGLKFYGSINYQDNSNALALDNSGYIYITGFATQESEDFVTIKYLTSNFSPTNLQLTAFIEGFYNSSTNSQIGDTVYVQLRHLTLQVCDSAAVKLSNSGTALINFYIPDNNYYISIRHRNSILTYSAAPVPLTNSVANVYDFTNAANKAFGDNMKQVDTSPLRFAIYGGDVNQDGIVDLTDITIIFNDANAFLSGYLVTDVTGDEFVDLTDITLVYNNSNAFVEVIHPSHDLGHIGTHSLSPQ